MSQILARFSWLRGDFWVASSVLIVALFCTAQIDDDDLATHRRVGVFEVIEESRSSEDVPAELTLGDGVPDVEIEATAVPPHIQIEMVGAALEQLNPGFDSRMMRCSIEQGEVITVEFPSDLVTDISPLAMLKNLARLTCKARSECGRLTDLSYLTGLRLTYLDCSDTCVEDLSPLRGMPLLVLHIEGTRVVDLSPLKRMPLKEFYCARTPVLDLSPLAGLPLEVLNCERTRIDGLTPLWRRTLRVLHCGHTLVSDLAPLKGLKLRVLDLRTTPVAELTPLIGMPLEQLDIRYTRVDSLVRIRNAPLARLSCGASQVSDLSPVRHMQLTSLECSNTKIDDLSPLLDLPLLVSLDCTDTYVVDLSPLQNLVLREVKCDLRSKRDIEILRSISTLERINGKTVAEFWSDSARRCEPLEVR